MQGPWVSAHPDVILKMGVKDVLYRTRHLGWGADTHRYHSSGSFRSEFPSRLRTAGPRVIKQNRGNGGQGVWKVERLPCAAESCGPARAARKPTRRDFAGRLHGSAASRISVGAAASSISAFQPRLPDGMIRCYMSGGKVAGFGHQIIKALIPPPPEGPDSPEAQPGPRIMHGLDSASFQALRTLMENQWTPQMMSTLASDEASLPVIWDADFLYGPPTPAAPTPTSFARSTRVRASPFPTRHRTLLRKQLGLACHWVELPDGHTMMLAK